METMETRTIDIAGVSITTRDDAGDGHTITGIAVPYGEIIETWDGQETFDRSCIFDGADTAKIMWQHQTATPIGTVTKAEPTDKGLMIDARISDTQQGRDALTLVRDGVIDSLSIGFRPIESIIDADGVTHRTHVTLLEVSLVSWPAYSEAKITGTRGKQQPETKERKTMTDTTITERLDGIDDQIRRIQARQAADTSATPAAIGAEYRSAGEYVKAVAAGDTTASKVMDQARDLISTGDTGNASVWITDQLRLIQQRRKVSNILTHDSLPDTGMTMEYNLVATDSTAVAAQASEGNDLTFGKVTFGTKSVTIGTYGGYTTLSRQAIERSTTPMLDTAISALTTAYAKATEGAVRAYLYAQLTAQAAAGNKIDAPAAAASMTIDQWASLIIDAAELADDRNTSLTRLGVSTDVMKALIALTSTGDRYFNVSGTGADTLGDFDLTGIAGTFLRLPVQILPGAPAGTAAFIDPASVTIWESGGPTQLTDGSVTALTNSYSVYGYLAVASTQPDGLIPVSFKA